MTIYKKSFLKQKVKIAKTQMLWICENCNTKMLEDIPKQIENSKILSTKIKCEKCGSLMFQQNID